MHNYKRRKIEMLMTIKLLVLFTTFMIAVATEAEAAQWFVAPNGNDKASGTIAKPFASLARAQAEARKVAGKTPITVYLRAGTYYLTEPLVLTSADSGKKGAPIVYRAYQNETVVVSGGQKLALDWRPYRDGIMQAKVPDDCATDQLFVNGQRRILARYPNYDPNQRILAGFAADAFSTERAKRWADPTGGIIHAMQSAEWGDLRYRITGKDSRGNVTYEGGWQNNRQMGMHRSQRYVENIFEEWTRPTSGSSTPKPIPSTTIHPQGSTSRTRRLRWFGSNP